MPINAAVILKLEEREIDTATSLFSQEFFQIDGNRFTESLRVYSGCSQPKFNYSKFDLGKRTRTSELQFTTMPAFDTWTVRVRSRAPSVGMSLSLGGTESDSDRKRMLGLELSVQSIEVSVEQPSASEGPRSIPDSHSPVAFAALGPVVYLLAFFVLQWWFGHEDNWFHLTWEWEVDTWWCIAFAAIGLAWHYGVKRPVMATMQGYRLFWVPNSQIRQSAESAAASADEPRNN